MNDFRVCKIDIKALLDYYEEIPEPVSFKIPELIGLDYDFIKSKYKNMTILNFNEYEKIKSDWKCCGEIVLEKITIQCAFDRNYRCVEATACTHLKSEAESGNN